MPNIRFPFVDAHDADHRIFHSGNQGFADDRDRRKVDLIPVRSAKDLLFVAENRPPQRPEPLDLLLGARDFENKILRHEAIERIAEKRNFPSREAPKAAGPARQQRRYRTGRDQHLGIKTTTETRNRFYKAADERKVPLGELLRLALDALERAGGPDN